MGSSLQQQLQDSLGPDFLLQRELGAGGMSRVFLAEEKALGRRVVVKVLSPDLAASISAERFDREIRLAAQLQDPRIVPLLRAGTLGDLPFYTMPYVEGESLRARLTQAPISARGCRRHSPRPGAGARVRARAQRRASRHQAREHSPLGAHGRRHRLRDRQSDHRLHAFGTAAGSTLTGLGTIVGTPAYMAPEQAAGELVDPRADIYAWGVIAYEMLGGVHPFASHTTAQAVLAAHIAGEADAARRAAARLAGGAHDARRSVSREGSERSGRPDAAALVAALKESGGLVEKRGLRLSTRAASSLAAIAVVLVAGAGTWAYVGFDHRRWARDEAIPQSNKLLDADRYLAAFQILQRAKRYLPADTQIVHAYEQATNVVSDQVIAVGRDDRDSGLSVARRSVVSHRRDAARAHHDS